MNYINHLEYQKKYWRKKIEHLFCLKANDNDVLLVNRNSKSIVVWMVHWFAMNHKPNWTWIIH